MGTNYYWRPQACPHCHRAEAQWHIGKSSAGWCFALHVMPEEGIEDLPDWETRWRGKGLIVDEYGEPLTPDEMLGVIRERRWNHAEPGPNGLVRHRIGGISRCVRHGAGTWDCIEGEFR